MSPNCPPRKARLIDSTRECMTVLFLFSFNTGNQPSFQGVNLTGKNRSVQLIVISEFKYNLICLFVFFSVGFFVSFVNFFVELFGFFSLMCISFLNIREINYLLNIIDMSVCLDSVCVYFFILQNVKIFTQSEFSVFHFMASQFPSSF